MTFIGRNVTLAEIQKFYGAHQKKISTEDRPMLLAAKCRPMILVSRNVRYMRILVGVPSGRGRQVQRVLCLRPDFEHEL